MKARICELCNGEADLFCSSDSAFLCWNCDDRVHQANFLVARHVRLSVCSKCKGFTGDRYSGVGFRPSSVFCGSCPPGDHIHTLSSLSSSSPCISSTESCATSQKKPRVVSSNSVKNLSGQHSKHPARSVGEVTSGNTRNEGTKSSKIKRFFRAPSKVDIKTEAIFVKWCSELGVGDDGVIRRAGHALDVSSDEFTLLPFRASLATSLWFSLRLCGDRSASTCQILKRLEHISGVPAKLILAAESRLLRVVKVRKPRVPLQPQMEEGWAESSANTAA